MPEAAKREIRNAMAQQADDIVRLMKQLAPHKSGTLRDSIQWKWGAAPRGSTIIAAMRGAGVGGDLTLAIYAGGPDAYYARWLEFGTVHMDPHPFFFVSWRAKRRSARRKVRAAVRTAARRVAAGG